MIERDRPLLLGSSSPRRKDFLTQLGLPFETCSPEVDETIRSIETPSDYVMRMAVRKMDAVQVFASGSSRSFGAILTADTVVVSGSQVLTKPQDERAAISMLSELSGATHQVLSAYCLCNCISGASLSRCVSTDVRFRSLSEQEVRDYVATGEGRDKAGSYAIQGIGAFLVEAISGSYSNVVGLPVCELVQDMLQLSIITHYP